MKSEVLDMAEAVKNGFREYVVWKYIRFKDGEIRKVIGRDVDGHLVVDLSYKNGRWLTAFEENDIRLFGDEIIDIVEVGDYVNGERVLHIDKCLYEGEKVIITELNHSIFDNMIDDIVTKEQFNQIKYEV